MSLLSITRSAMQLQAANTISSQTLRVWLQVHTRFVHTYGKGDNPPRVARGTQHARIHAGMLARVKELFGLVSQKLGKSGLIEVRETRDVPSENVSKRDIVIYFVTKYSTGVINRRLWEIRDNANGNFSKAQRDEAKAYHNEYKKAAAVGMTYTDSALNQTICEVWCYPAIMSLPIRDDEPSPSYEDRLEKMGGRLLGNLAFHEALHNQIDAHKPYGFDLHNGTGLAGPPIQYNSKHDAANISDMANHIRKNVPQHESPWF